MKTGSHPSEVVSLDKVSSQVSGRCSIHTRSYVMPGHTRLDSSVKLVYDGQVKIE